MLSGLFPWQQTVEATRYFLEALWYVEIRQGDSCNVEGQGEKVAALGRLLLYRTTDLGPLTKKRKTERVLSLPLGLYILYIHILSTYFQSNLWYISWQRRVQQSPRSWTVAYVIKRSVRRFARAHDTGHMGAVREYWGDIDTGRVPYNIRGLHLELE